MNRPVSLALVVALGACVAVEVPEDEEGGGACDTSPCDAVRCGLLEDACGESHECPCETGHVCELAAGSSTQGVCVACEPKQACDPGICGVASDLCGGELTCEPCPAHEHCFLGDAGSGTCGDCPGGPCAEGELCRADGKGCLDPSLRRCWGTPVDLGRLSETEPQTAELGANRFPTIALEHAPDGTTWLWFATTRFEVPGGEAGSQLARVRLVDARTPDLATLERPAVYPLEGNGNVYHATFSPGGDELFVTTDRPDFTWWDKDTSIWIRGVGGWERVGRTPLIDGQNGYNALPLVLPDGRGLFYKTENGAAGARVALRPSATPGDGGFVDRGPVTFDEGSRSPRHASRGCDGRAIVFTRADDENAGELFMAEILSGPGETPALGPAYPVDIDLPPPRPLAYPSDPAAVESADCQTLYVAYNGRVLYADRVDCD